MLAPSQAPGRRPLREAARPPMSELDVPAGFRIRPSRVEDAEGIQRCLDAVARERRHIAMLEAPPLEQVRSFVEAIAAGAGVQFVALQDEAVVGWCDVLRNPRSGFRHSAALGMGLLAPVRGRGIGRALLAAVLEGVRPQGLQRIELEVYAANRPAIALYEHFGFAREGVKQAGRVLDGEPADILCMALLLPPLASDRR